MSSNCSLAVEASSLPQPSKARIDGVRSETDFIPADPVDGPHRSRFLRYSIHAGTASGSQGLPTKRSQDVIR
jgi:hypothetical protein